MCTSHDMMTDEIKELTRRRLVDIPGMTVKVADSGMTMHVC